MQNLLRAALVVAFMAIGSLAHDAENVPVAWFSHAVPGTSGSEYAGQPLPGCPTGSATCWLPSAGDAAADTVIRIYGMEYCGHSKQAANRLLSFVTATPGYVGRYFWGNSRVMDDPVSIPKADFKARIEAYCAEHGCPYRAATGTFPVVFVGGEYIGGNSEFQQWANAKAEL